MPISCSGVFALGVALLGVYTGAVLAAPDAGAERQAPGIVLPKNAVFDKLGRAQYIIRLDQKVMSAMPRSAVRTAASPRTTRRRRFTSCTHWRRSTALSHRR